MKRTLRIPVLVLAALALLASSCTRSDVEFGSPTGPSSFDITFDVEVSPNVVYATAERPVAVVRAYVRKSGSPWAGRAVYFTITSGPGEFEDYSQRTVAYTDYNGVAQVSFFGPSTYELGGDTDTNFKIQLQTTSPDYMHKYTFIRILKGPEYTAR
jgi:hypothetical protein